MEKLKFSFMKKLHIGLLPRILIAIAFGILFGNFLPGELIRLFVTFNGIFSEFLNFSIPLIIVGLVTVAIADIGKGAGKLLLITALIAYGATLFSGFLSYFTGVTIGEFYQFNLSSCIRQQNSLTAQFVSFSLSNLANIFYPPQFLQ